MKEPSQIYLRALANARDHHLSTKTYSGKFLRPHAPVIKALLERVGGTRILDYGCGKGEQYSWVSHGDDASIPGGMTIASFWGNPALCMYDPAYPPLASPTPEEFAARNFGGGKFDVTIITHVLGSIPIGDLVGWVLPRVASLTGGAVYIAEKIGEVGKAVFAEEDVAALPRWGVPYWRGFIQGASVAYPNLVWVLATTERTEAGKISSIREYVNGKSSRPTWLPNGGPAWLTEE